MRKLIMWNLMSLDGYVEGPNRDINWHNDYWGPELENLSKEQGWQIGALIFGRVTYDLMAGYWPTAEKSEIADYMTGLPKYVFSRTMKKADWVNTTLVKGDAVEEIEKLKRENGKDIFVFGSADLSTTLLEAGLYDELRIGIAPLLLADGTPLFKNARAQRKMKLIDTRQHSTGVILARYQPS